MKLYATPLVLVGILLMASDCTPLQECFSINAGYRTFLATAKDKLPKTRVIAEREYHKEFDERNCLQFGMARY